jgi:hypothetical protein
MFDDAMVFDDISLREVAVSIQGKGYILREAHGEAARRYRNTLVRSAKLGPDGKPTLIDGIADAEMVLVNECLVDKSGRKTPIQVLAGWPNRVLKLLFRRVLDISDLGGPEDDSADGLAQRKERLLKELAGVDAKLTVLQGAGEETDPTGGSPEPTTDGSE